jgi:hypothetical protein
MTPIGTQVNFLSQLKRIVRKATAIMTIRPPIIGTPALFLLSAKARVRSYFGWRVILYLRKILIRIGAMAKAIIAEISPKLIADLLRHAGVHLLEPELVEVRVLVHGLVRELLPQHEHLVMRGVHDEPCFSQPSF